MRIFSTGKVILNGMTFNSEGNVEAKTTGEPRVYHDSVSNYQSDGQVMNYWITRNKHPQ